MALAIEKGAALQFRRLKTIKTILFKQLCTKKRSESILTYEM
jgi:hypothetical protein